MLCVGRTFGTGCFPRRPSGPGACCSEEELEVELSACAGAGTAGGASVLEAAVDDASLWSWAEVSGEETADGEWSRPTHPSGARPAGC